MDEPEDVVLAEDDSGASLQADGVRHLLSVHVDQRTFQGHHRDDSCNHIGQESLKLHALFLIHRCHSREIKTPEKYR